LQGWWRKLRGRHVLCSRRRVSTRWIESSDGSLAQVTNPTYAADALLLGHTVTAAQYAAARAAGSEPAGPVGYHIPGLADVPGWAGMDVVDAAHHVQRSAFPDAVADDIPLARRLVATFAAAAGSGVHQLSLTTEAAGHCVDAVASSCPPSGSPGEHGLKPDTLLVLRCIREAFPRIKTFYGFRPHDAFPDHPLGRAVDIMINSAFANYRSPAAVAYGDQIAAWVRARHEQLGVRYIIWRQHIWNVERAGDGWRPLRDRGNPTANHLDHVHVTTYGNAAKRDSIASADLGAGRAVSPVEHYRVSARSVRSAAGPVTTPDWTSVRPSEHRSEPL
jgi:hypothetical protein